MSKHTTGPWHVKDCAPYFDKLEIRAEDCWSFGYSPIAVIKGDKRKTDAETRCANARLIAAAPTMHDYIKTRAEAGDAEAIAILATIDGPQEAT
jgi:hypothetical protein